MECNESSVGFGGCSQQVLFSSRCSLCSGSGPRYTWIMNRGGDLLADCHPQGEVRLLTGAEIASTSSSKGQNSKIAVFQFHFFESGDGHNQWSTLFGKSKFPPRLCLCWRGKEEGIGACWGIPRITFRHPPGHSTRISAGTAAHCWHLLHFYPTHDLGKKTKSLSWVDLGETHLATAVLTSVELSDGAKAIGERACSGEGPSVCPQGD